MTVVDTSAVVAVLFEEPGSDAVERELLRGPCVMSAATRVELGIVIEARARAAGTQLLEELLARTDVHIAPVDERQASEALVCWRRFGKGRHRAALNLGDTFAYALARQTGQPLLCVGDDFTHTDIATTPSR
ncbi:type II toxin-antitoxin system VapC family toxin [Candidatus Poriferisodalis sp.]|uniref:type II toxin-antitoxin system VapC family toxin n=1 Tax=Candidatus Poriferisodalis sp. TaxID=3101277 RepID=UPI003C6F72C3